jgi:hypothetical protein
MKRFLCAYEISDHHISIHFFDCERIQAAQQTIFIRACVTIRSLPAHRNIQSAISLAAGPIMIDTSVVRETEAVFDRVTGADHQSLSMISRMRRMLCEEPAQLWNSKGGIRRE